MQLMNLTMRAPRFANTKNYLADDELTAMVNLAITRNRPLLVTGEAGTGKTELAFAIAQALNLKYEMAQMTSTMQGEEVAYTYDAVLRLTDAQLLGQGIKVSRDIENPMEYVRYGAVGRAFVADQQRVVLLDEIDKTTSDVQDDLLRILDKKEFEVREANTVVKARHTPIMIITSNGKRELSDPFLRRCYTHHIEFPDQEHMKKIVRLHYPQISQRLLDHSMQVLYELRGLGLEKPPATGELLEWVGALQDTGHNAVDTRSMPYTGILIKRGVDLRKYNQHVQRAN